ncbi:hypothetical protein RND81_11G120500 [Saponaria officinalis]|uniref:Retrotransposon gag domain-containing protein n=1 Tax=Saponaria officinalis TaxID=3572 RepID=A0AAW1HL05_SAPOF
MATDVARSASDDESVFALRASHGNVTTGVFTRSRSRSILAAAAARLRSTSVPTRLRSRRPSVFVSNTAEGLCDAPLAPRGPGVFASNTFEGLYDVTLASSREFPVFDAPLQVQVIDPLFNPSTVTEKVLETLKNMTIHTSPLFEPYTVEDVESSNSSPSSPHGGNQEVSDTVIAPVMTTDAQTMEEQFAEMKMMLEQLKKENEGKSKQIADLTKKLGKRPESSKHSSESDESAAESDVSENGKKRGSGASFTAKDIKPYSKRIDYLRMPIGYQPPKFQQFDGKGNPKQHIAHVIETCNTAGSEDDLVVKQFVRSLKGIAFDWYTDLSVESIDSWDQMEQEFLNRFYSTRRVVRMTKLTNTKQWKYEAVIDYINRWRSLSLECKDRLSEVSAVEMCIQGMNLDLVYILQGIKPRNFQELATRAHDMDITIASHGGRLFPRSESKPERKEFKKTDKSFKSNTKDENLRATKVGKEGNIFQGYMRTRPTLKELEKKKYPFPDSDLAGMLDDLLEKKVIELPESKRRNEAGRTTDPKYCRYHRVVSHPLEKCITLKEKIMQLAKDGKIMLDLDDAAESNCIVAQAVVETIVKCPSTPMKERVCMIQFGTLEPVVVCIVEELSSMTPLSNQIDENEGEWTLPHNRPLFVSGYIREQKVSRILVDGGSVVNIMPKATMLELGISASELTKSRLLIQGFNLGGQRSIGMIRIDLVMGELSSATLFQVIDAKTSYKLLLGRPWLHENGVVASTLHQCLKFYRNGEKKVNGDVKPFTEAETYFADAKFYHENEAQSEMWPTSIATTGTKAPPKNEEEKPDDGVKLVTVERHESIIVKANQPTSTQATEAVVPTASRSTPIFKYVPKSRRKEGEAPFAEYSPQEGSSSTKMINDENLQTLKQNATIPLNTTNHHRKSKPSLQRFVAASENEGETSTKGMFDPNAYKLLSKSGYDFENPIPMGKVVEVVPYGLNQTQRKLHEQGNECQVTKLGIGYTPSMPNRPLTLPQTSLKAKEKTPHCLFKLQFLIGWARQPPRHDLQCSACWENVKRQSEYISIQIIKFER